MNDILGPNGNRNRRPRNNHRLQRILTTDYPRTCCRWQERQTQKVVSYVSYWHISDT
jgi:hypothetical protein